jgi:acyl-CoA thioester hydrolase
MNGQSGRIEAGQHVMALRVYYEDTDSGGMVYYANYLKYAERARTEMLRLVGVDHETLAREHDLAFVVRSCTLACEKPARLDDLIEVRSRLLDLGGASLTAEQVIGRNGTELARLDVRLACMTAAGRPTRIPKAVREALAAYGLPSATRQPRERE